MVTTNNKDTLSPAKNEGKFAEGENMVERKFANMPGWKRILQSRFYGSYLDTPEFKGQITLYCMDAVTAPLMVEYFHRRTCIVDAGYAWLKQFPAHETTFHSHYSL